VRFDVPVVPALSVRVEVLSVVVAPPSPRAVAVPRGYKDATAELLSDSFFDKCGVLESGAAASGEAVPPHIDGDGQRPQ
jgi:hypothetical protein